MDAIDFERQLNIDISNFLPTSSNNKRKKKVRSRRKNIKNHLPKNPPRAPLLVALGIVVGIGVSRWDAIADSARALIGSPPIAIAQQVPASPPQPTARPITIKLEVSSPEDIKVEEDDVISKGQIISDRTEERERLMRQKTLTEKAIATATNTKLIPPPKPKPVPEVQPLPPMTLAREAAAIESAELELRQAKRAYSLALQDEPYSAVRASLEAAKYEWDDAIALSNQAEEILAAIVPLNDEIEISHYRIKLEEALRNQQRLKSRYQEKEAELERAKQLRKVELQELIDNIALKQAKYEQAQANYIDAKNRRSQDEYNHRIQETRRIEEANKAESIYASQEVAYQNSILRKEQQLFSYREKLDAIAQDLEKISVVRSRWEGKIQRVKRGEQTGNSIEYVITLIPGQSDRSTSPQQNPFNSITGDNGTLPTPNSTGDNPFNNIPD